MARIRSVHPSLFTDEAWVSCSPLARILYIGLWTDADDQGLFEWKPLQIKMRLLPGDAGDVPAMLAELEGVGLICAYQAEGKRFGAIANFRKFQRPQKPNAIHPLPENIAEYVCLSPTDKEAVQDQSATDPVNPPQMEDGGEEVKETAEANASSVTHASKSGFEDWWREYPDAVAKPAAAKAYAVARVAIGGDDPDAVLLAGLRRSLSSARWSNPNHTRPNPARWLAEERWNDRDPPAKPTAESAPPAPLTVPSEIHDAIGQACGTTFASSYLCGAVVEGGHLLPKTRTAWERISGNRHALLALKQAGLSLVRPEERAAA